jgi:hypothetical protein
MRNFDCVERSLDRYLAQTGPLSLGFNRMISAGLKYPTRFNDTHLQHV